MRVDRILAVTMLSALSLVGAGGRGAAQEADPSSALPDAEITERLRFIEERLHSDRKLAVLYQTGWSTFYGIGTGYQLGQIAITTGSQRGEQIVGAVKAFVGTTSRLLRPPHAMLGTRELRDMPRGTPEERARRLLRAEWMLKRNARESDLRYNAIAHSVNVALNVVGGLVIWLAYDDWQRALQSAGIGIAVGEAQIWSQPWQSKKSLRLYRERFGRPLSETPGLRGAEGAVSLRPVLHRDGGGGAFAITF